MPGGNGTSCNMTSCFEDLYDKHAESSNIELFSVGRRPVFAEYGIMFLHMVWLVSLSSICSSFNLGTIPAD